MASTNDLKNGMVLNIDGQLWAVVDFQHVKPGKGPAFVRTKLRNVESGKNVDKTFNAGTKVETATVDRRTMQYLYNDGTSFVFMDTGTYDQIEVSPEVLGDGANFPGQHNLRGALERYLDSAKRIYAALPDDWLMYIEHKLFEPAFYSSVISDWGSSILAAQELGPKAKCLVDLGHHAPNVNIEQIVARLHRFGKLGGFHFNDSKYGDDDLDSGAIDPHQLFLVFNELVEAELHPHANAKEGGFDPAYMIDQSHNVTDPIESMLSSAEAITGSFARALLVDREALHVAQEANDTMMAFQALRRAYTIDVGPILARARAEAGGAIDVLATYRESRWRERKAQERKAVGLGAGIV